MAKRYSRPFKFQDVKQPWDAWISIVLNIVSLVLIVVSVVFSVNARGNSGVMVGMFGLASIMASIVGFVFSIASWKDVDATDSVKRGATFFGIIMLSVNLLLLLFGIIS